jgi:predicted 3-demethylubiquinone-9 3-methyltransferase (glyoxalase superfamily)
MTQELGTCLWFDKKAKEAFLFYKDVFGEVELLSENPMAVVYKIYGRRFMNLNGGPEYTINPSISFFISATNQEEIEAETQDEAIEKFYDMACGSLEPCDADNFTIDNVEEIGND